MKLKIDTKGNEKQKECAINWVSNNGVHDIVYGGSKGSGKSYIGASLIFADAFVYPETHYFIARAELNDLRKFTIPTIHEVFEHWGIGTQYYNYNGQDNYFQLYNKSKVYLLAAKYLPSDPRYMRFGSMQMTRGMIEEAGEFHTDADMNLSISVGRWKNDVYGLEPKVLRTCNPSKNYLYKDYYKPYKNGTLEPSKVFIQALPTDNKMLPKGYIEQLKRKLSRGEKERLLYGNWEYDNDPLSLVEYDNILAMFENDHIKESSKRYITADIARYGSDKAVILLWEGWKVVERYEFPKASTVVIQNKINELRRLNNIPKSDCVADDDGVGGGVVDNTGIEGFVNNARPFEVETEDRKIYNPKYQNLKTQCAYYLADKIQSKELWYAAPISEDVINKIVEEVEQLKRHDPDNDKVLKLVPKKVVSEKIGRSTDDLDPLIFRGYFDLRPKAKIASTDFHAIVI